jgi:hypothetical protein
MNDFPLMVSIGEEVPAWGLSRWKGNSGLRFVPPDDEGFTLRGDNRRLVYKGRRRSHRFTILGDGAFEYDVILYKEPESNVIVLPMEGAKQFDFFRQPEFVADPFLKGSYAVYKKETLIGEGTGKLCHIHRPEIIDAMGRRCWGDLSVVGDCLCITIPEGFLGEAAYPVVVDPTIGTTTVGSQTHWNNVDNDSFDQLFLEVSIGVNRFLVPEKFDTTATAYVYAYESDYGDCCRPVLYSDNNMTPLSRRSMNEGLFDIAVNKGKSAGWRSVTFKPNASISGGSYVWFGLFCDWFAPRFDYGARCYWDSFDTDYSKIPDTYPLYDKNYFYDFKLSMYFTYTSAQNYVRTISQGVKLSDARKLTASYKRDTKQTAKATSIERRTGIFYRKCVMTAQSVMGMKRYLTIFSRVLERVITVTDNYTVRSLFRKTTQTVQAAGTAKKFETFVRECVESVTAYFGMKRIQGFIRELQETVKGIDRLVFPVLFIRKISDNPAVFETTWKTASYIKTLEVQSGNSGDIRHKAEYHRLQVEEAEAGGAVFRGLTMLVRLFSGISLRDYLIQRFLKAREELRLKSCISREIMLNSKII